MSGLVTADCRDWLPTLPDGSADLVVLDPPYRPSTWGDRPTSQNPGRYVRPLLDDHQISEVAVECARVVRPGGYALVWMDWWRLTHGCGWWNIDWAVDELVVWQKQPPIRMGIKARRNAEAVYILQQPPLSAPNGTRGWLTHDVPTVWAGQVTGPPMAKPVRLQALLMRALLPSGLVVDPFTGSGSSYWAAQEAGLDWMGCDIEGDRWWTGYQPELL